MKSLFKSVATLSLLALLTRVMGFVFKIYLSRQLGAVNIGIYQVALSIFFVLVTCTSSGIPLVVGKFTARYRATHSLDEALRQEGRTVSAGIVIGLTFACMVCIVLFASSNIIKQSLMSVESFICLLLLLPALIASTISNSMRGAFWGRGMYKVSSILEIIEQAIRIGLCILLFNIGTNKLIITAWTFSLACVVSTIICVIYYYLNKGRLLSPTGHIAALLKDSAPITLSRISSSIVNMIVAFVIPLLFTMQGASKSEGLFLLGASIGMAFPLLFTPNTFVGSLAYVMLPDISSMYAQKNPDTKKRIENGISISIAVSCAFIPIFWAIGSDIGLLLFNNSYSGEFIVYSAWILLPLAIESIVSSMMNALELEMKSLLSFAIGSTVMLAICFAFVGNFSLRIFSIAFGTSLTISSIIDMIFIKKRIGLGLSFVPALIECGLLIIPAYFVTKNIYTLLNTVLETLLLSYSNITYILSLSISSMVGIGFYAIALYIFDFAGIFGVMGINSKSKGNRKSKAKTLVKT